MLIVCCDLLPQIIEQYDYLRAAGEIFVELGCAANDDWADDNENEDIYEIKKRN